MDSSQFMVHVRRTPWSNAAEIGIIESRGGRHFLWQFKQIEPVELTEGPTDAEPTFRLQSWLVGPFFKALAEALEQQGIKTDSDAKLAGTMEATRLHLEDMRRLVFKAGKKD
jgi:hypothetical protein